MASTWLMAEPSLSPLAQRSASPNRMSEPAMPGAMRTEPLAGTDAPPSSTRSMPRSKRNMSCATVVAPSRTSIKPIGQAMGLRLLYVRQRRPRPAANMPAAPFGAMLCSSGNNGSKAERSKYQLASTRAPMAQTTSAQSRARPSATLTARGTGKAILTGTSITGLPHPSSRGGSPGEVGYSSAEGPKNQQQ